MSAAEDSPAAFLETAVLAARAAGELLRSNFGQPPNVNEFHAHDIKLELDVRCQTLIAETIFARHPDHGFLGEEGGVFGDERSPFRWVVDPLDGTVNYFYAIPHFCVSVALTRAADGASLAGVIYDPMREEIWTAHTGEGGESTLNGRRTHVSERDRLGDAIVSVGLAKITETIEMNLPVLGDLVRKVRKGRMMGSAALDLAYVASGRLDAYIESGISIWDVAAGTLIVERAGGRIAMTPRVSQPGKFAISATSGRIPELAADAARLNG